MAEPQRTLLTLSSSSIVAGNNVTGGVTLFDASGNQRLADYRAEADEVQAVFIMGTMEVQAEVSYKSDSSQYKLNARLLAAGQYLLQVSLPLESLSNLCNSRRKLTGHTSSFSLSMATTF